MVFQQDISIQTSGHGEMTDLTPQLRDIIAESGVAAGIANLSNIGSTGAIGGIEFEPGLERDLPEILDQLIPAGRHYGHEAAWHDGNAHSHLQATILGQSLTLPIADGLPRLGTWQQIVHLECDIKPRRRIVVVTILGE